MIELKDKFSGCIIGQCLGDAAGFVKDTTGGGIITGMLSSKALAESISSGKNYEKCLKNLRKEFSPRGNYNNARRKICHSC